MTCCTVLITVLTSMLPSRFQEVWSDFGAYFHELMAEQGMIGGSVWFFHEGEAVAKELFGLADVETGRAVDEDTIFHWGSITKTLTGIAIMQLRDRSLIDLDDPVVEHLPELRTIYNPYGDVETITLRHIMTHSAGFRAATWPWGGSEPWHPFEPTRWDQLVAMFPYTEVQFEPGSRFSYSNPAVIFLGRIIEELSGEDYEVYVDKHILKPLGMHRSYFDRTPPHLLRYRSNNYTVVEGEPKSNGLDFDTGITVSNSGLNAPIPDLGLYASFLTGLMGHSTKKNEHEAILSRSSLEEMWKPSLRMSDPVAATTGSTDHIGLVFFLSERGGHSYVGHTGSQAAFNAFLYVEPRSATVAIAAFNSQGEGSASRPDARYILAAVRDRLFDNVFPLFPAR